MRKVFKAIDAAPALDERPTLLNVSDATVAEITVAIGDVVFDLAWHQFLVAANDLGWDIGRLLDEDTKAAAKAATFDPFRAKKQ